jgi:hypothetical protein
MWKCDELALNYLISTAIPDIRIDMELERDIDLTLGWELRIISASTSMR